MKKVKYRHSVSRVVGLSLAVLLAFSVSLFAQEGDPVKGNRFLTPIVQLVTSWINHPPDRLWQVWRISMSVGGCKVGLEIVLHW